MRKNIRQDFFTRLPSTQSTIRVVPWALLRLYCKDTPFLSFVIFNPGIPFPSTLHSTTQSPTVNTLPLRTTSRSARLLPCTSKIFKKQTLRDAGAVAVKWKCFSNAFSHFFPINRRNKKNCPSDNMSNVPTQTNGKPKHLPNYSAPQYAIHRTIH